MKLMKLAKPAGILIVLLSFVYIGISLWKLDYSLIAKSFSFRLLALIVASILVYNLANFFWAYAWYYIVLICSRFGIAFRLRFIISIYFKSNIAKYLPGNVFHFAGRHYYIRNRGVSDTAILLSNGFEIFFLIFTAFVLSSAGLSSGIITLPDKIFGLINGKYLIIGLILAGILLSCLGFYSIRKKHLAEEIRKLVNINTVVYLIIIFLSNLMIFLIIGTILYALLLNLTDLQPAANQYLYVLVAFCVAWVLGYIVPGAPGGLGVRETVLIILLGGSFSVTLATTSALLLRLITVCGDISTYFISYLVDNKNNTIAEKV